MSIGRESFDPAPMTESDDRPRQSGDTAGPHKKETLLTRPLTQAEVGSRLDRLAWSPLHTTILVALGAGWLFDSFEVQMFSNAVGPLGDYFRASVFERDAILAVWLVGILIGALAGGRLADRFGRRRLFVGTLLWYAGFTVATGLSPDLGTVYALRFLAALGVGAEYAIVNAAIAELIPARVRGKANAIVMNFWPVGAIAAGLLAYLVLDTFAVGAATSWRYLFVFGGLIALVVLFFRRRIPESPRWLVARGRHEEAEEILVALEARAERRAGMLGLRYRPSVEVGLRQGIGELLRHHRGRLALGALLDLAEAFGYYGIFALLSVVVLHQVHISNRAIPFFYIVGNVGGLAGGLSMAAVFDRAGHRLTVGTCYLAAAGGVGLLALATASHSATMVTLAFVVANAAGTAAWTSAYPTFTELFPTHLRGVGVGTSVAIGRVGAIVGTLLLPAIAIQLGATASYLLVIGFWLAGVAAIAVYSLGGGAEPAKRSLEFIDRARRGSVSRAVDAQSVAARPVPGTEQPNRSEAMSAEPPRRIAVCGGPYSNPYALSAFVDDARRRGCDELYCLGDLGGFGAQVNELWPILQSADITCIAGNYDVAIARGDPDCGCGYRDPTDNEYAQLIYDYTRTHTSPDFAAWMGRLPTERRARIGGCDVHFVHGSPLALNDFWWESLPEEEHRLRVEMSGAQVICCTHSGLPWKRRFDDTLVVNVGVLGKPANDGGQGVWYAIIEIIDGQAEAELIPLAYDWEAQASSMRAAQIPELFIETIRTGWWTTCLEVLPPAERARGRYHLYRSALPTAFTPAGGTWSDDGDDSRTLAERTVSQSDNGAASDADLPVVPLFGTEYFPRRLWVYTNFHCNLACDYCAVGSSPRALPRLLSVERFHALIDEALDEGFNEVYLTGGEPLLHPDITKLLAYSTAAFPTVLLTNATVLRATRLDRLRAFAGNPNLVVQTSLDGARPATHDAHRGAGTWAKTMDGIATLVALGVTVRVAMTETPENTDEVPEVAALLTNAGVPGDCFVVRPLLRRGLSDAGLDITETTTVPELTVAADGLYWHPAGADQRSNSDMRIADPDCTLKHGKQLVVQRFLTARLGDGSMPRPYRCAV